MRVHELNPTSERLSLLASGYWEEWRNLVPSAMALLPIQAPHTTHMPGPGPTELPANRDFFVHISDAIGIRSRAEVLKDVIRGSTDAGPVGPTWLSLACGAALPVLQTAAQMATPVTVDLVDLDPMALGYAVSFAEALGLADRVRCMQADLLNLDQLTDALRLGQPGRGESAESYGRVDDAADLRPGVDADAWEGYDFVEMMGFFEYLPDEPQQAGVMTIPSAGEFLETALSLAAPGGLVVFGNMLTTHPQIDFTLKVVQWPYVRPRSLEQLVDLVTNVGVAPDQVTIYTPDDGVYAVVAIEVPAV